MLRRVSDDICVFAGARNGVRPAYASAARELGRVIATRGHGIVYGGGRVGLMGVVADAGLEHGARVTGVIPRALATREVAHAGLSELIVVGTMHERKAKMAALSRDFVALPGGYGTLEELAEVVTWVQLGLIQKPLGLLDVEGFWQPYLALLDHFAAEGFIAADERKLVIFDSDPERLVARLETLRVSREEVVAPSDL
jgi:uncharacterized protein (TIGR00730 family)